MTQKPPASVWKDRSKVLGVLCTTGKISDFTAACPWEREILPPSWYRILSSRLAQDFSLVWTVCHAASIGPAPCSGGNLEAISYRYQLGPSYPPLNVTFMGSFDRHLSGQDRTEQCLQSTFLSEHAHQQSQNYWRDGPTNSSASLCCGCMQCGRACIPQRGQNSLRTSRWEPL